MAGRTYGNLSELEFEAIVAYISNGPSGLATGSLHTQLFRAKKKLQIEGFSYYDTLVWALKNHPGWIT